MLFSLSVLNHHFHNTCLVSSPYLVKLCPSYVTTKFTVICKVYLTTSSLDNYVKITSFRHEWLYRYGALKKCAVFLCQRVLVRRRRGPVRRWGAWRGRGRPRQRIVWRWILGRRVFRLHKSQASVTRRPWSEDSAESPVIRCVQAGHPAQFRCQSWTCRWHIADEARRAPVDVVDSQTEFQQKTCELWVPLDHPETGQDD